MSDQLETTNENEPPSLTTSSLDEFTMPDVDPGEIITVIENDAMPEMDDDEESPAIDIEAEKPDAEMMTKDAFYAAFKYGFGLPEAMINPAYGPIAIQSNEEMVAREASDTLYDVIEGIAPDWLLQKDNKWMAYGMLAYFVGGKVMLARAISKSIKVEKMETGPVPSPVTAENADTAGVSWFAGGDYADVA